MESKRSSVHVDVWSDIACPWCWVGKRNLEEASRLVDVEVRVTYRAFQLNPEAPASIRGPVDYAGRLARKYRVSDAQARGMLEQMSERGRQVGLTFHFSDVIPTNTFDSHRLLCHARHVGNQVGTKERLLRAYFAEGCDVADPATLIRLAKEMNLPEAEEVVRSERYADEVQSDLQAARSLGITGVPFFLLGGRLAVSGAQAPELLAEALEKASQSLPAQEPLQGEACSITGC